MKKHLSILIVSILILGLGAGQAHASDKALAALGGFVAGVITGVVIEDGRDRVDTRVVIHGDSRGHRDYRDYGYRGKPARSGHWETKRVRVWVPGRYEYRRDRCGYKVRVWVPGHYEWRKERVWVSYRDRGRGHCRP